MKVFIVYEYRVVEYEESFDVMSVHSTEEKAKEAIAEYETMSDGWVNGRAAYGIDEYELDNN